MKKLQIQKIEAVGGRNPQRILWTILLSALLLAGGVHILLDVCGFNKLSYWGFIVVESAGVLCSVAAKNLKKQSALTKLLYLVPWILLLTITLGSNYFGGAKAWINAAVTKWNLLHDGGLPLLLGETSETDLRAFLCVMMILLAQICCVFVQGSHLIGECVYCLIISAVAFFCGTFSAVTAGVLACGVVGTWTSTGKTRVTKKAVLWTVLIGGVLAVCSAVIPNQEIPSILQFQEDVKETVSEIRYGQEKLPEGDLRAADQLKSGTEEELQVQSEQEKNFYLRGYVGGKYDDGVWLNLPDSAYGGENAGMLKWLKNQNFDPLTQVAEYYSLSTEDQKPEKNQMTVLTKSASREHAYLPITLEEISKGKSWENKDLNLQSSGLFGTTKYTIEERSGSRPSELTVAQDWVSAPETEAQTQYTETEKVYRQFVYEEYTAIDSDMNALMQELFWKDYDSESDGIYSAVTQIRKVLKTQVAYTDTPKTAPEGEDPVVYFLTESGEGNAMLYASAAVEALRAHGIPARYAEGYYLSSDMISEGGVTASVTGQDAHAWAEVYFDGIGWLPIDVTPGYYYDAVALQQMVSTPDMVHKNAALDPNSYQSAKVTDSEGQTKSTKEKLKEAARITIYVVLGAAGVALILLTLLFSIVELRYLYYLWRFKISYTRADAAGRVRLVEEQIYRILACMEIKSSLGWETEETDQILSERFDEIKPGEYKRTCALLEKSIYGEIELEPYEERTVNSFIRKLYEAGKKCSRKMRLKLRYTLKV